MKHILAFCLLALDSGLFAQPAGTFMFQKIGPTGALVPAYVTPENSKTFAIDSSGNLVMTAGGGGTWGSISGSISAQTDLATAFGLKAPSDGATLTNATLNGIGFSDSPGTTINITAGTTITIPSAFGTAAFADFGTDELQLIRWATAANPDAPASILTATALGAVKRNVTALPVNLGGTNATTATAAVNNLLPAQTDHGQHYLRSDGVNVSWDPVDLGQSVQGFLPGTSFPALEGDVTTEAGSLTTTIATGAVGPTQIAATAVTPGSYTATNLTVDADGRITAASNGSSGITIGTTTSNGTAGRVLYTDGTNVQAYDKTGSGSTVVMSGGPTFAGPVTITGGGTYLYFSGAGSYLQLGGSSAPSIFGVTQAYEVKNGTQNVGLRVYNTETSATNYERAVVAWASNTLSVGTQKGSGGGTARDMILVTDDTERVRINSTGLTIASGLDLKLGNTAVAETPTATHTLIIKDSAGVSYRVLAVPLP